jgi:DNA-directed RNA polymerase subunit M/transcription elongation factor TFIIS
MTTDTQFIKIAQRVLSERGDTIIDNSAVFNSLLADYAKGEYTRERRLLVRDLREGRRDEVLAHIKNANDKPSAQPQPTANTPAKPQPAASASHPAPTPIARPAPVTVPANGAKKNEMSFIIRCPRCGNIEKVTAMIDLKSRDIGHLCPQCGNTWTIRFFGQCKPCRKNVGFNFYSSGKLLGLAATAILDIFNLKDENALSSAFKGAKDFAWRMAPEALSSGVCPLCTQSHVECPKCGAAVVFPHNKQVDIDLVKCPACGQKMRHP